MLVLSFIRFDIRFASIITIELVLTTNHVGAVEVSIGYDSLDVKLIILELVEIYGVV